MDRDFLISEYFKLGLKYSEMYGRISLVCLAYPLKKEDYYENRTSSPEIYD